MRKIVIFILACNIQILAISQTVIDYQSWNPSSPPCNLFGASTDVSATINGTSTTIPHLTNISQPYYNANPDNSVNLDCSYNIGGIFKGTQYQITNNFLEGYSYKIIVNASVLTN